MADQPRRYESPLAFNAARDRYAAEIGRVLADRGFSADLIGPAGGFLAETFGDVSEATTNAVLTHHSCATVLLGYELALAAADQAEAA